ncbi:MAG: hypothetical protein A2275_12510 [Bacteroidetes bacterium RIFOXYA12_FULL_35_11]|nr:MAG: hypothetical protein A2X01_02565 [Bacteroidetes bacterium GWF2_35_48]OFY77900.1 MAG: hypothetical protein A2275_12510 [Bacteroidetes bacterium RIFOXYA12_FULL_35_11]OFY96044.1 MAG: hypothetical protein A2491_06115 [Bacteroidetes bacterium RIFOXYC12_FULL_35_7]HBX50372.1 hypothetical protein [Bacteroidales bacterium]
MDELRQIPLLRLAIPFIAGIALSVYLQIQVPFVEIFTCLVFLSLFVFHKSKFFSNYQTSWIHGMLVHLFFIFCGFWLVQINHAKIATGIPENINLIISGVVSDPPAEGGKSHRIVIEADQYKIKKDWQSVKGKILLYLEKDSLIQIPEPGDKLVFITNLSRVKSPANPSEFDYRQYLYYRHIVQQGFIKKDHWKLVAKMQGNSLVTYANRVRNYLIDVFRKSGLVGDELAVAAALTIGYKDLLEQDIRSAYSSSGAMHILAVSGLHVGIIFVIFNFLLFFLEKFKNGKLIKACIIILLLWFYAFITGLSPAVLRAATMFTFVVIGKSLNRQVSIYNSMSGAALILLFYNPFYIADVGFQLSFIAVIGIVALQPGIYKLLYFKSWLPDKIWGLVAVSLAAQIATLPITLYHFHQFPNYFILTNIVAIPLATLILYMSVMLFVFSFWDSLLVITGKILIFLTWLQNSFLKWLEELPYAVTSGINITATQAIILSLMIVIVYHAIKARKLWLVNASLVFLIFFQSITVYENFNSYYQKKIIVYKFSKAVAINFIYGTKCAVLEDNVEGNSRVKQVITGGCTGLGIDDINWIPFNDSTKMLFSSENFFRKNSFMKIFNTRFVYADNSFIRSISSFSDTFETDYLYYNGNKFSDIKILIQKFSIKKKLIFNGQNQLFKEKVLELLKQKKLSLYDLNENEALVVDL